MNTLSTIGRRLVPLCMGLTALLGLNSCHDHPDYPNDALTNFNLLWQIIDQHYCFLDEKGIDWNAVHDEYLQRLSGERITYDQFFTICADMLDELQDGHVNLVAPFNTSYYRKWWSDYPQDFNLRTLQQYYLQFDYRQTSGISYRYLTPDSIGYMYYPSFSNDIGELNLDYIMAYLSKSRALIIDIRNNGGGTLTNIDKLVGRLITEKITGGYLRHKTGPGHNDFSDPYPVTYKPCDSHRIPYLGRPVMVLTNRSCFSAANNFVSVVRQLPNVRIAGARTGGGGGLPFSAELPIGWSVRFSASPLNDAQDRPTENGIDPSPGCEVHCTELELAEGTDAILDFALRTLIAETSGQQEQ